MFNGVESRCLNRQTSHFSLMQQKCPKGPQGSSSMVGLQPLRSGSSQTLCSTTIQHSEGCGVWGHIASAGGASNQSRGLRLTPEPRQAGGREEERGKQH